MKYDKSFLRNQSLLLRKKKYLTVKKFNYNLIFRLIRRHFYNKKITSGAYYPSKYEVNVLKFLEDASKKNLELHYQLLNLQIKCLLNHGFSKSHFM